MSKTRLVQKDLLLKHILAQEYLHFYSRYLHGVETRLNRPGRNYEGDLNHLKNSKLKIFSQVGKPLLRKKYVELSLVECV